MCGKPLLWVLVSILYSCDASGPGPLTWDYNLKGEAGPSHWGQMVHTCSGTKQSPINLEKAQAAAYAPLQLEYYDLTPSQAHLTNNGHTLKLTTHATSADKVPTMKGGGLPGKYKFSQVHFHWGSKEEQGSEHQVNGKAYPLEMHLVHFKETFGNLTAAAGAEVSDSLAVLGVFFEVSGSPNPGLSKLLPRMAELKRKGSKITDAPLFPVTSLLDTLDTSSFFRYSGSLTTPGCNEIVQWTVLKKPISVTRDQLEALRGLQDAYGKPLVDNYRPLQALGQRKILSVSPPTAGVGHLLGPSLLLIVVLQAAL